MEPAPDDGTHSEIATPDAKASTSPGREHDRKTSLDSLSSNIVSSTAAVQNLNSAKAGADQPGTASAYDVFAYIKSVGTAEGAVARLLHEKTHATSHNAQLWRLVEKQRAMILGLNKDLEKALKEKEKYRERLKVHKDLAVPKYTSSVSTQSKVLVPEPAISSYNHGLSSMASCQPEESVDTRPSVSSIDADAHHRQDGAVNHTSLPPSKLPAMQIDSPVVPVRSKRNLLATSSGDTSTFAKSAAIGSSGHSMSSPKYANRKAPPAPLRLRSPVIDEKPGVDSSASEYEDDPLDVHGERTLRGRRRTREEDDRERELQSFINEFEERSVPPKGRFDAPSKQENQLYKNMGETQTAAAQRKDPVPQQISNTFRHPVVIPHLLSPGLPMSPRPGDRPLNSPMPRAPNKALHRNVGVATGLSNNQIVPVSISESRSVGIGEASAASHSPLPFKNAGQAYAEIKLTLRRSEHLIRGKRPGLTLTPKSLDGIFIRCVTSRYDVDQLKQGALSLDLEHIMLTLAVCARVSSHAIWQVEKTLSTLASFDTQVKIQSTFRHPFLERADFAKSADIMDDKKRLAVETYFDRLLTSSLGDRVNLMICQFLTSDILEGEHDDAGSSQALLQAPSIDHDPESHGFKAGYLTKRGKNFGGWKARYFVLQRGTLRYFEAPGGAQLGSIYLQNAQIGRQSQQHSQASQEDNDGHFRHAFLILEPKKKDSTSLMRHVLCAENDEARDEWVQALLRSVDAYDDRDQANTASYHKRTLDDEPSHMAGRESVLHDTKDRILSVSYSDTIAGKEPVIGPSMISQRDRSGLAHNVDGVNVPSHMMISAPSHPVVIQNMEDWGSHMPPTPTSRDATKDRKRGMFAALLGRSSPESIPEKDILGSLSGTSVRGAVFGATLVEAVHASRTLGNLSEVPLVPLRCIEYLKAKDAQTEEGIFRLSGSNITIKALKDRFNIDGDVDLLDGGEDYDIHAVAGLLKLYLRELPTSILTRELHLDFLHCLELALNDKLACLRRHVSALPKANRALLDTLTAFLLSVVENAEVNKMNLRNVGIVFAPTLNVPGPLICLFVEHHAAIFATDSGKGHLNPPPLNQPVTQQSAELRSPRTQSFSNLPTSPYNQTTFASFETGMTPLQTTRLQ